MLAPPLNLFLSKHIRLLLEAEKEYNIECQFIQKHRIQELVAENCSADGRNNGPRWEQATATIHILVILTYFL